MKKKQIQKIESKERLLNVSSRLFKTKGFEATGIDEIMSEAGMTAGAFYAHFASKADLLRQVIEHSEKVSSEALFKSMENLNNNEWLLQLKKRYQSRTHRDFPEKGCILPSIASEIYRADLNNSEIIEKYIEGWISKITKHLPEQSSAVARAEALKMISQMVGSVLLSRMLKNCALSDELLDL